VSVPPLCSLLFCAGLVFAAQDLQEPPRKTVEFLELQKAISEFTLPNGVHFIVAERHQSPVVSFHTLVNVGSLQDPSGETGLAHMFGLMAFKGTETIGTRNWPEEKKALDAAEEACDRMEAEVNKGASADQTRVDLLRAQFRLAVDNARRLSGSSESRHILEENGAVSLAASVSAAASEYAYSFPSNRAELWFLMESQRLMHPVFRDFYAERDGAMADGQRLESNPPARMMSELLAAAFKVHPYRNPSGGWPGDIQNLRRTRAQALFERYNVPGNITVAIVGDVAAADAKRLAERYFGPIAARPLPPLATPQEPPQNGPKTVIVEMSGPPIAAVGYKRPSQYDKDDLALGLLQVLLSDGRTGILYNELVQERRLAQLVRVSAIIPEGRFPNLFAFLLVAAPGRTVEENQLALGDVLQRIKFTAVDAASLARAKARARAGLIRGITANRDLARLLARYSADYGDWRKLFTSANELNQVGSADIQRAANRCFVAARRTTVYTVLPGQSDAPPRPPEHKAGGPQ
jgi:predicted Zn-dependent peptidase